MPRHRPFVGMEIGWTRPLDRIAAYCVVAAQKVYEVKSLIIKEIYILLTTLSPILYTSLTSLNSVCVSTRGGVQQVKGQMAPSTRGIGVRCTWNVRPAPKTKERPAPTRVESAAGLWVGRGRANPSPTMIPHLHDRLRGDSHDQRDKYTRHKNSYNPPLI